MPHHSSDNITHLTPREIELIGLQLKSKSHKMMADILHIKFNTVKAEMQNLHLKLHVHNSTGLLMYALANGFSYNQTTDEVYYLLQLVQY